MFPKRIRRSSIVRAASWSLAGAVLLAAIAGIISVPLSVQAATATVRPNGDVTAEWGTAGTSDGTCSGAHCTRIDEASPNTADYIETGILLGGNMTDLFEMSNTDVGQGATQIRVRTYARSGFSLPVLDAMDQIVVSLWINGSYIVGSPTITPSYPNWNWFETTFTGNWNQAQVDAMRVRVANSIQGLGLIQNNLQVAMLEAVVTYTPSPVLGQTPFRLYQNANSTTPGSALAATNTAAELGQDGAAFRLRLGVTVGTESLPANYQNYKLQYAPMSGTCDTGFSGETYTDVLAGSGPIRWFDNPGVSDGAAISSFGGDPTTSGSKTYQTYRESNPFTNPNATSVGNTALWDFSLQETDTVPGTTYCFRLVRNDGSLLNSYTHIPAITTVGSLDIGIVDGSGNPVASPTAAFNATLAHTLCQTAPAIFGTSSQRLRVTNNLVTNGWTVSIAPTDGPGALWTSGSDTYDFNDPSGSPPGCADGADADTRGGRLGINPSSATITPASGCSTTGITKGSATAFQEGVIDSIQLLNASSSSQRFCWWDITGIALEQVIPPIQPSGTYSLNLTVTILAQ